MRALCVGVFTSLAFLADFFCPSEEVLFLFSVCFSLTDKNGLLSAMAIAALCGGDSRIHPGGHCHEATYRRPSLRTRSSNSFKTFSSTLKPWGTPWDHRRKCQHLTARSEPPPCMARVVGDLPRNEHSSAVDNGLIRVRRSPAETHTGDTERAAIGFPGQLSRRTARLQQHFRPAILGSGLPLHEA